jgi:molybdate transport system permease protein
VVDRRHGEVDPARRRFRRPVIERAISRRLGAGGGGGDAPAGASRLANALGAGAVGAVATVTVLFLGLPIAALLVRAVTSGALAQSLGTAAVVDALVLSLVTTAASLGLTVVLGTPLAYALSRRPRLGAVAGVIVDLPIVLPPSVAGLALLLLFGRSGALGTPIAAAGIDIPFTTLAVVIAQVFVSAPFYVRSARAGFVAVDHEVEDAARIDGAGEWQVARRVTLPLAAAALTSGAVMSWARALGEFGATIMFAGNVEGRTQTLPLVVYSRFQSSIDASVAAAAVLVVAAAVVLLLVHVTAWRPVSDLRALV